MAIATVNASSATISNMPHSLPSEASMAEPMLTMSHDAPHARALKPDPCSPNVVITLPPSSDGVSGPVKRRPPNKHNAPSASGKHHPPRHASRRIKTTPTSGQRHNEITKYASPTFNEAPSPGVLPLPAFSNLSRSLSFDSHHRNTRIKAPKTCPATPNTHQDLPTKLATSHGYDTATDIQQALHRWLKIGASQ